MSEDFQIELFTPAGKVLEGASDAIKLIAIDGGEIEILSRHIKYVGQLGTGIMHYRCSVSNETVRAVIIDGFCSFSGSKLLILADNVDLPDSVDKENYANERDSLKEFIQAGHLDDPDRITAQQKLKRIETIDKLISH